MANSQNGWPVRPSSADMDRRPLAGVAFPNGVLPGDVATIFGWLAQQFHIRVEPLVAGWCWGYNNRAVTGGSVPSNHASGTAVDFNAPRHPYGSVNTFTPVQRAAIRQILAEADGVLRWGGDYTGKHDDMHFEINTPNEARVATLARKLTQAPVVSPPVTQTHREDHHMECNAGTDARKFIPCNGKPRLYIATGFGAKVKYHAWLIGEVKNGSPSYLGELDGVVESDEPGPIELGRRDVVSVSLLYTSDAEFTAWCTD